MLAETLRSLIAGRVRFTASGGFAALFLAECAARGAVLRQVKQEDGCLRAHVAERAFPSVLAAAERAGMTVTETGRSGLPPLLRRLRGRPGIPVGVLLGALLLAFLSGRLWEVTVTGNERVGSEEILDVLAELGVIPGAPLRRLDAAKTERQAQERLPKLSWIAVNIVGCKVNVEVREIIEKPELTDEKDYANIVAARDGVIVSADVLEGAGQPQPGTAVVKGDLLVSGIIEMNNGFQRFVNAKAHIRARTRTSLTAEMAASMAVERVVRRRNVCSVCFFGASVPLGFCLRGGETEADESFLQSRTTVFPIGVRQTHSALLQTQTLTLPDDEALLCCFSVFCEQASARYRDAALLRRELTAAVTDGTARVSALCECEEEIAARQPFAVDQGR